MTLGRPLTVVLDMQDRRPVWAMPTWVPERIGEALPEESTLHVIQAPNDGSGDGSGRVDPEVLAVLPEAHVYLGHGIGADVLTRGGKLRWVHSGASGVGGSLTDEMRASPVVFTNSAGVHARPIAETVVGMILYFLRGFDLALAVGSQTGPRWDAGAFYSARTPVSELADATVGVVGFGGVGRAVAERCRALGASVLALRRRPPDSLPPDGLGSPATEQPPPDALEVLWGEDGLERLLRECDVVVLCVPETPSTVGLIGSAQIDLMKPGALLINVARGGLVDSVALTTALVEGRLRGAALDVFDPEPIPDDHPLWSLPNVLVTPHVSGVTARYWEREVQLIVRNLERLVEGAPLLNVVDKVAGY